MQRQPVALGDRLAERRASSRRDRRSRGSARAGLVGTRATASRSGPRRARRSTVLEASAGRHGDRGRRRRSSRTRRGSSRSPARIASPGAWPLIRGTEMTAVASRGIAFRLVAKSSWSIYGHATDPSRRGGRRLVAPDQRERSGGGRAGERDDPRRVREDRPGRHGRRAPDEASRSRGATRRRRRCSTRSRSSDGAARAEPRLRRSRRDVDVARRGDHRGRPVDAAQPLALVERLGDARGDRDARRGGTAGGGSLEEKFNYGGWRPTWNRVRSPTPRRSTSGCSASRRSSRRCTPGSSPR